MERFPFVVVGGRAKLVFGVDHSAVTIANVDDRWNTDQNNELCRILSRLFFNPVP
jgi:hypothetical protein